MPDTIVSPIVTTTDPVQAARAARLRYVSDTEPGIRREMTDEGFRYFDTDGREVTDEETLGRIRSLVIPPAWTEVWICARPNGHLQATGRDARSRKQYRYHPQWRSVRDETKYGRTVAFAQALPRIRERVEQDLARPGMAREKILATVVRLLETTLIRVGNEEYVRANKHYGLTTLKDRHVSVNGSTIRFSFKGKSGVRHTMDLRDRRLARIVKRSQDLPGQELFQYVDESGVQRTVGSADVNAYLREISGDDFTAKDFRTWAGTVLCAAALHEIGPCDSAPQAKKNIAEAVRRVAERLGNTPAVCRQAYIHPQILEAYEDGTVLEALERSAEGSQTEWDADEEAVLGFLRERLESHGEGRDA